MKKILYKSKLLLQSYSSVIQHLQQNEVLHCKCSRLSLGFCKMEYSGSRNLKYPLIFLQVLFAIIACASARPQFDAAGAGATVTCERREVAPGRFEFACQANPGTLVEEKTLWVPTSGGDQELLIRVPNYQFREIIRAGLRGGNAGGTNVSAITY